jgi:hypothetical protein
MLVGWCPKLTSGRAPNEASPPQILASGRGGWPTRPCRRLRRPARVVATAAEDSLIARTREDSLIARTRNVPKAAPVGGFFFGSLGIFGAMAGGRARLWVQGRVHFRSEAGGVPIEKLWHSNSRLLRNCPFWTLWPAISLRDLSKK